MTRCPKHRNHLEFAACIEMLAQFGAIHEEIGCSASLIRVRDPNFDVSRQVERLLRVHDAEGHVIGAVRHCYFDKFL